MQLNKIGYQPNAIKPNFQAKIRIEDEATADTIEDDICTCPSKAQVIRLMDQFDQFQKDKIISIKYTNCERYKIKNESNNI